MKVLKFTFLFILLANESIAQKAFTFSSESGAIWPKPIFYKGIDASSNDDREIIAPLGIMALVNCKWNYDRKSYFVLGLFYESYSLYIKEFVKFPSDLLTPYKSYLYSSFDASNLGFRISFGNQLRQYIKLNAGFQIGFPLNNHFGYIYVTSLDLIENSYDYETHNPFALLVNIEYQWYSTRKFDFTLVPEFVFNIQKNSKTHIYENQIRKLYFALRLGVNFKS